ncbi:MAG: nuclear transport factor 2 family protein [Burkholderiales bacterium]
MTEADAGPAATVRAFIDALNRGNADEAAACVSHGFVNEHISMLGVTVIGREAYRDRLRQFLVCFRGLHYDVEQMIVDGCHVAVAYRMSASWRETGADGSADRPFSIRGMFRFQVEAGRISHRADYWDSADFLRQVRDPASPAAPELPGIKA